MQSLIGSLQETEARAVDDHRPEREPEHMEAELVVAWAHEHRDAQEIVARLEARTYAGDDAGGELTRSPAVARQVHEPDVRPDRAVLCAAPEQDEVGTVQEAAVVDVRVEPVVGVLAGVLVTKDVVRDEPEVVERNDEAATRLAVTPRVGAERLVRIRVAAQVGGDVGARRALIRAPHVAITERAAEREEEIANVDVRRDLRVSDARERARAEGERPERLVLDRRARLDRGLRAQCERIAVGPESLLWRVEEVVAPLRAGGAGFAHRHEKHGH